MTLLDKLLTAFAVVLLVNLIVLVWTLSSSLG